jgi:hypothetical protein
MRLPESRDHVPGRQSANRQSRAPLQPDARVAAGTLSPCGSLLRNAQTMARCSARSIPWAVTSAPDSLTRQARCSCQQYPNALRGLVLSHARQQVGQAVSGRMSGSTAGKTFKVRRKYICRHVPAYRRRPKILSRLCGDLCHRAAPRIWCVASDRLQSIPRSRCEQRLWV